MPSLFPQIASLFRDNQLWHSIIRTQLERLRCKHAPRYDRAQVCTMLSAKPNLCCFASSQVRNARRISYLATSSFNLIPFLALFPFACIAFYGAHPLPLNHFRITATNYRMWSPYIQSISQLLTTHNSLIPSAINLRYVNGQPKVHLLLQISALGHIEINSFN